MLKNTTNNYNIENFVQQLCIGNEIYKCFNKLSIFNETEKNICFEKDKKVSFVFYVDNNGKKFLQQIGIELKTDKNQKKLQTIQYEFCNYQQMFNFLYSENNLSQLGINNFYNVINSFLNNKQIEQYVQLVQKNLETTFFSKKNKTLDSTDKIVDFFYKFNFYINNKTAKISFVKYNNGIEKIIEKTFTKIEKLVIKQYKKQKIAKLFFIYTIDFLKKTFLLFIKILDNFLRFFYLIIEILINTLVIFFVGLKNIALPYFYNFVINYINNQLDYFYNIL